jgi:hypothetical protein
MLERNNQKVEVQLLQISLWEACMTPTIHNVSMYKIYGEKLIKKLINFQKSQLTIMSLMLKK